MAFGNGNTAANATETNDQWKAAGFLNVYLPNLDGSDSKLGALSLRLNDEQHVMLNTWISEDPVARTEILKTKMKVVWNSSTKKPGKGFDLS